MAHEWETRAAIRRALTRIECSAMIDGADHKQWVLDQVVRALTGGHYEAWVKEYNAASEAKDYAPWDVGIAP